MNKKTKLLNALQTLEMKFSDKKRFVDLLVDNSNNNGGGDTPTELQRNDVNFFDYDGTLLYAYTWDEAKELTELPPLPTHENMEVREWNYTLEDIKMQGVHGFEDNDDSICFYAGDVTINDVSYKAYSYDGTLTCDWAYMLTKEPQIGDVIMYANYDSNLGEYVNFAPDTYEIINVLSTIGKADIGACCYDKNGELIQINSVGIIPRGLEEANYLFQYGVFSVISIPNTVTVITSSCFYYCTCLNEIKIPISVNDILDYYPAFHACILASIWWNGINRCLDFLSDCNLQTPFIIPNTFGSIGEKWEGYSGYVKFPNTIQHIEYLGSISPNGASVLDFSEAISVPQLNECHITRARYYIIIVPDYLYDVWTHATNWVGLATEARFIKASECSYLIK